MKSRNSRLSATARYCPSREKDRASGEQNKTKETETSDERKANPLDPFKHFLHGDQREKRNDNRTTPLSENLGSLTQAADF